MRCVRGEGGGGGGGGAGVQRELRWRGGGSSMDHSLERTRSDMRHRDADVGTSQHPAAMGDG